MKIISKSILADAGGTRIFGMDILAADIAQKALPGQFVVLMVRPEGERIPLTVVDSDRDNGTISVIFQEAGLTTGLLARMRSGDSLYAIAGPLGHPTPVKKYGKVIAVGAGVGIAEVYPVVRALKEAGNEISVILGARSKSLLILEDELRAVSGDIVVTTDDGSSGRKGFATGALEGLLKNCKYDLVYAVGPIAMMRLAAETAARFNVRAIVSLNALMLDATGMCGCCRVRIGGETKFSCVDGPEFDASLVDWGELENRNRLYLEQERHICRLKLGDGK
ncbi:MAG: sulfide/dihydroorotate dehydrogenase-like FAD/NAD-binding protein [Candidatus Omnitrophota bacterium]